MTQKIATLGPEDTNSHRAAKAYDPRADILLKANDNQVIESLLSGETELGILPIHNTSEGYKQKHMDHVYEHDLQVIDGIVIPIEFYIGKMPGSTNNNLIYSHHMALQQCSNFIRDHLSDLTIQEVESTSRAVLIVQEKKSGYAISSLQALKNKDHPLELLTDEEIGNVPGAYNKTTFYVISRSGRFTRKHDSGLSYSTVMAITPNLDRPGLLAELSTPFSECGVNMRNFHSRPNIFTGNRDASPTWMFYIETEGHETDEAIKETVRRLNWNLNRENGTDGIPYVKIFGSYSLK